jgi:hypothetical protein
MGNRALSEKTSALKRLDMLAQGNALGWYTHLGDMLTSPPGLPRRCDDSLLSRRYRQEVLSPNRSENRV